MTGMLRQVLATLVAPPAPVVDLFRRLRFRGRAMVVVDLPRLQAARSQGDGLSGVIEALEGMVRDPMVRAVRLRVGGVRGSLARLQELREVLRRLDAAGKPVLCEATGAGDTDLYVASAATRVTLVPAGEVTAGGLALHLTFFGAALERLGVGVDVVAAGRFKSLGEPFTRSGPSPENREAMTALVDDLQEQVVGGIARGRKLDPAEVRAALEAIPLSAEDAVARGLVDEIAWPDQVDDALVSVLGFEPLQVPLEIWQRWAWVRGLHRRLAGVSRSVVVVHLTGNVVSHGTGAQEIAADEVVPALRALEEDEAVVAVVLAVDSRGGSALASDLLWRAVERLVRRKPVVALFGSAAASGGYYLAVPAVEILCQPATLTGSIGVVGLKLVLGRALQRVGVHGTTVARHESAGMASSARHFTRGERDRMERSVEAAYTRFLDRVAAGRRRPVRSVEPVAGGRVWTGRAARELGLVDGFGTLRDAWCRACTLAGVPADEARTGRVHVRFGGSAPLPRLVRRFTRLFAPGTGWLGRVLRAAAAGTPLDAVAALLSFASATQGEPLALLPWWDGEGDAGTGTDRPWSDPASGQ